MLALRDLETQQKANNDAIVTQAATLQGVQDELGSVEEQIRSIDGTLELGGCA